MATKKLSKTLLTQRKSCYGFDGGDEVIPNVADPKAPQDVVTKAYLEHHTVDVTNKATALDINRGEDDSKYVTAKAIHGSGVGLHSTLRAVALKKVASLGKLERYEFVFLGDRETQNEGLEATKAVGLTASSVRGGFLYFEFKEKPSYYHQDIPNAMYSLNASHTQLLIADWLCLSFQRQFSSEHIKQLTPLLTNQPIVLYDTTRKEAGMVVAGQWRPLAFKEQSDT